MKRTLTLLLLAAFALMVGARGQIVNPPQGGGAWPLWADASGDETRTNLGLGAGWLTNTNTPLFTQGSNPATVLSPWIVIGTNVGALQIASNAISGPGSGMNFAINEIWGSWGFLNGIQFIGTNATAAAAITRTNLGLGASWLTNSNVPTPYSGAAPTGAILAADGAGGSAFGGSISIYTNGGLSFGSSTADNIILRAGSTQVISAKYDNTLNVFVNALQLGTSYGNNNSYIYREDLSMLGFRRFGGTNEQSVRIYGAYSNTNDYRRLNITAWTNGVTTIKPEGAGTGASNNVVHISGLPTNNPGAGILWNSNGAVMVGD